MLQVDIGKCCQYNYVNSMSKVWFKCPAEHNYVYVRACLHSCVHQHPSTNMQWKCTMMNHQCQAHDTIIGSVVQECTAKYIHNFKVTAHCEEGVILCMHAIVCTMLVHLIN